MMIDNKINVLITGPYTLEVKGGQVSHIKNIISTFSNHAQFQVKHFVSSSALENKESSLKKLLLMLVRSIKFPFFLFGINLIHLNSTFDNKALLRDIILIFWSFIFGKRLIVQYHGGNFETTIFNRNKLLKYIWVSLIQHAEHVLVLTEPQLVTMQNHKVSQAKKIVNYVSCTETEIVTPPIFTFIFLGRIIKEKGIFEILAACKQLQSKNDFRMLFYGDGPDRLALTAKIEELDLSDKVIWKGMVDGKNKVLAFTNASAFILPSYSEGLPYSVLEAMSYGLAVISTDVGSLTQLVKHDNTGLIVKVKDEHSLGKSMAVLLEDKSKLDEYSNAARELIKAHYSNDKMKTVFSELWSTKSDE
jgi:glycosyltransferase involved in cell wall biosynthesis